MLALMEWTWIKDIPHLLCCLLLVAEHEGLAAIMAEGCNFIIFKIRVDDEALMEKMTY